MSFKSIHDLTLQYSYLELDQKLYTAVEPSKVLEPKFQLWNIELAEVLGIQKDQQALEVLSGNQIVEGTKPFAQAYAGHQFGYLNMLGDGRAIHLGELVSDGLGRIDIQLKGAGLTPYSRRGDGRGTYSSMLREYIISEAMHALGVPTTRSLAVIRSSDDVYRDEAYPMGILTRIASSHIRVGTFEYASRIGKPKAFQDFTQYVIQRHYPELIQSDQPILNFFKAVMDRQIKLVNQWLSVGFIHGVMNTDNVSIAGETIDFGPCAFMNAFDPKTVFSSIDKNGRYAYQNQKPITHWNLMRLAETLVPLISGTQDEAINLLQGELDKFDDSFDKVWLDVFSRKIGFTSPTKESEKLLVRLLEWMEKEKVDFTNTFRGLLDQELLEAPEYHSKEFNDWKQDWKKATEDELELNEILRTSNPAVIPRNHLVEDALWEAQENDNIEPTLQLIQVLKNPFDSPKLEEYQNPPLSESGYKTFCGT